MAVRTEVCVTVFIWQCVAVCGRALYARSSAIQSHSITTLAVTGKEFVAVL